MNGQQIQKFKSLIFDFDGTLAELRLNFPEMKRRLRELAQEYFLEELQTTSMPALEWLETLLAVLKQTNGTAAASDLEQRAHTLIKDIEIEAAHRGSLFPFTRSLLHELQEGGIKVAIITRNCETAVRIVFPDLDHYCAGFLARDHVLRVKPDPDHLVRALQYLSASAESALMVGDHPLDMQTGKSAGIRTAGVWSGQASEEDLIRAGASLTAPNCRELIQALRAQHLL